MKKNLVKKAVLPALVALLCSVVALTSVSYAWFTLGNTASVDGMDMKVTSAGGLQISASGDEGTFKSNLLFSDLKKVNTNQLLYTVVDGKEQKVEVVPVSTAGSVVDGKLAFYTGTIEDGQLSSSSKTTTNYMYFDVYVKVVAGKTLYLDAGSIVNAIDKETHLASRVAFVNLGYAATAAEAKALNTESADAIKIWEPNALIRSQAVKNAGNQTDGNQQEYQGIASVDGTKPVLSGTNVVTFAPAQVTDKDSDNYMQTTEAVELFELGEGYNKIRVYIWVEGQDVDCVNEISGGTFAITLKFKQDDTKTTPIQGE